MKLNIGSRAPEVDATGAGGEHVILHEWAENGPVVLVFLRSFS